MGTLKVLIVTGIYPPDHGGPASYVPVVAHGLAKVGVAISGVITLSEVERDAADDCSFPVHRIRRSAGKFMRVIRTIRLVATEARRADVVYVNGLIFESVFACKILSRRPMAVKVVGDLIWERACRAGDYFSDLDSFQGASLGLKYSFLRFLHRKATCSADLLITPSKYLARIVSGWCSPAKEVRIIYNAVRQHPKLEGPISKEFDLISVARFVPWKGLRELVRLAAANRWTLRLVGDGPERQMLVEEVRRCAANDLVSFAGHIPQHQVAGEILRARIFVLNSTYEGLPHVVIEAKLAGVPVVATNVGGTSEVIRDGVDGILVAPGNQKEIARQIAKLLRNGELRRRFAQEGQKDARRRFSEERMISSVMGALAELRRGA